MPKRKSSAVRDEDRVGKKEHGAEKVREQLQTADLKKLADVLRKAVLPPERTARSGKGCVAAQPSGKVVKPKEETGAPNPSRWGSSRN